MADETGTPTPDDAPAAEPDKTFTQAELDRIVADRVKRAKPADYDDLKAAAKRLATLEESSKSETERLVETTRRETEQTVRKSLTTEFGQRIAREQFLATAAKRNAGFDAAQILDDLNVGKYLDEAGEPDAAAITAAVERLIPQADSSPPSFDGGNRGGAGPMTDLQQIELDLKTNRRK